MTIISYLGNLIDSVFQGVDRNFALLFEDNVVRTGHISYIHLIEEIKDDNVMIVGKSFFDNTLKTILKPRRTYQGQKYTNDCLLYYPYFK